MEGSQLWGQVVKGWLTPPQTEGPAGAGAALASDSASKVKAQALGAGWRKEVKGHQGGLQVSPPPVLVRESA